eukprot:scaffold57108_cov63-Phaeocystis_antarctica.AAC.2
MAARGAGRLPSNHVDPRNCKASNSVFESPFGTAASYRGADLFAYFNNVRGFKNATKLCAPRGAIAPRAAAAAPPHAGCA